VKTSHCDNSPENGPVVYDVQPVHHVLDEVCYVLEAPSVVGIERLVDGDQHLAGARPAPPSAAAAAIRSPRTGRVHRGPLGPGKKRMVDKRHTCISNVLIWEGRKTGKC
jgi:hypothetical protein